MEMILADFLKTMQNNSCTQEQSTFDHAMRENIQKKSCERTRGKQAHSGEHESGMRNGGKSQQTFQVVLGVAHHRAEDCGDRSHDYKDDAELAGMRCERTG